MLIPTLRKGGNIIFVTSLYKIIHFDDWQLLQPQNVPSENWNGFKQKKPIRKLSWNSRLNQKVDKVEIRLNLLYPFLQMNSELSLKNNLCLFTIGDAGRYPNENHARNCESSLVY